MQLLAPLRITSGWPCLVSWQFASLRFGQGSIVVIPKLSSTTAQISEFEPTRAAEFGIRHFCWVAVNPKEAENKELTNEVLRQMPEFLDKPTCLGVGETGLHKSTPNEIESLQCNIAEMAMKHDQLVLIHTPHLSDKAHGTKTVLEVLAGMDVDPEKMWIDHVEEQTIESVLDAGYWAGMTLYPVTKCSSSKSSGYFGKISAGKALGEFFRGLGSERSLHFARVRRRISSSWAYSAGGNRGLS